MNPTPKFNINDPVRIEATVKGVGTSDVKKTGSNFMYRIESQGQLFESPEQHLIAHEPEKGGSWDQKKKIEEYEKGITDISKAILLFVNNITSMVIMLVFIGVASSIFFLNVVDEQIMEKYSLFIYPTAVIASASPCWLFLILLSKHRAFVRACLEEVKAESVDK